jgi:hypothetical protein
MKKILALGLVALCICGVAIANFHAPVVKAALVGSSTDEIASSGPAFALGLVHPTDGDPGGSSGPGLTPGP